MAVVRVPRIVVPLSAARPLRLNRRIGRRMFNALTSMPLSSSSVTEVWFRSGESLSRLASVRRQVRHCGMDLAGRQLLPALYRACLGVARVKPRM